MLAYYNQAHRQKLPAFMLGTDTPQGKLIFYLADDTRDEVY